MHLNTLTLLSASTCLLLSACGDDGEAQTDCDWGSPRLMAPVTPTVPFAQDGDLAGVLVGAWQHTHFIRDGVAEPLMDTTDIRFVFPGVDQMIYCQHITGVAGSEPRENKATITLDGTQIVLPPPAKGYNAVAWSETSMLWDNNFSTVGQQYLLQRR